MYAAVTSSSQKNAATIFEHGRAASACSMVRGSFQLEARGGAVVSGLERAVADVPGTEGHRIAVGKARDAGTEKQGSGDR
jgi:hypothetical protein